jgi:hypothetical protein
MRSAKPYAARASRITDLMEATERLIGSSRRAVTSPWSARLRRRGTSIVMPSRASSGSLRSGRIASVTNPWEIKESTRGFGRLGVLRRSGFSVAAAVGGTDSSIGSRLGGTNLPTISSHLPSLRYRRCKGSFHFCIQRFHVLSRTAIWLFEDWGDAAETGALECRPLKDRS